MQPGLKRGDIIEVGQSILIIEGRESGVYTIPSYKVSAVMDATPSLGPWQVMPGWAEYRVIGHCQLD